MPERGWRSGRHCHVRCHTGLSGGFT